MVMNTESRELRAVWEAIHAKATPNTNFDSVLSVLQSQQRWLRHYRELQDEFLSLWIVEILEFVTSNDQFTESDLTRAAERARYAVRKAVRRLSKEVPSTDDLLSNVVAPSSSIPAELLAKALFEVLSKVLNDEELLLLNSLLFSQDGSLLKVPAKTLATKIYRLRRKIEPIVNAVLGNGRHEE